MLSLSMLLQVDSAEAPEAAIRRWRARALDVFMILFVSMHVPILLVTLIKSDIPSGAKYLALLAFLFSVPAAFAKKLPHRVRVWLLMACWWSFALATLTRGGVLHGFRVVIVSSPIAIMLLGGIPTGLFYAAVNIVVAGVALWATGAGLLALPVVKFGPGEWWFQLLPIVGAVVLQVLLLGWFTQFLWGIVKQHYAIGRRLQLEAKERKRLELEVQEAGEREKQRIGIELHDGVCQDLTALLLQAKRIPKLAAGEDKSDAASQVVTELVDGLGSAIGEIHGLARQLSPGRLTAAKLPGAIGDIVRRCNDAADAAIVLKNEYSGEYNGSYDAMNMYRFTQEALANAIRHSGAGSIEVKLAISPTELLLSVEDDGRGLPEGAAEAGGLGLRTLRWRAEGEGGEFEMGTSSSGGTRVACLLKWRPNNE